MPSLTKVDSQLIAKLQQHIAYKFWNPIIKMLPILSIPVEKRKFHAREVELCPNHIYMTVETKFVIYNGKSASYLYPNQKLSYRFVIENGILYDKDKREFSAILGSVGRVTGLDQCELINVDNCFHPFFNDLISLIHSNGNRTTPAIQNHDHASVIPALVSSHETDPIIHNARHLPQAAKDINMEELALQYGEDFGRRVYNYRLRSKKSYQYLANRFKIPEVDVIALVHYWRCRIRREKTEKLKVSETISPQQKERILHLKHVSRRSYEDIARRMDLPVDVIVDVCRSAARKKRDSAKH